MSMMIGDGQAASPMGQAPQPAQSQPEQAKTAMNGATQQMIQKMLAPVLQSMNPNRSHLPSPAPMPGGQGQGGGGSHIQMQGIMGLIQMGVQHNKEQQLRAAMGDWMNLQSAYERAEQMAGDPSSMNPQEYQKKVMELFKNDPVAQAISRDPKKSKNFAKAFQVDLLNPDKNNVYAQALKRTMEADKAGKMMKMLRALHMSKKPQAQLSPDEQKQFGDQQLDKMGSMRRPNEANPETLRDILKYETEGMKQDRMDSRLDTKEEGQDKRLDKKISADEKKTELSWKEKWKMFEENDAYKRWNSKLQADTRIKAAAAAAGKPSQSLQPVAVFARTGLNQLKSAMGLLDELQEKGVLGNALQNKVEDIIFGKGFADPHLDSDTRQKIGKIRAAFAYTDTAAMRAHTGRTSKEIYDDFKNTLKVGEDLDALRGAAEATIDMLTEYGDVLTETSQKNLRTPISKLSTRSGGGKNKPASGGEIVTDPSKLN